MLTRVCYLSHPQRRVVPVDAWAQYIRANNGVSPPKARVAIQPDTRAELNYAY